MIKELKRPKNKSNKVVIDTLLNALRYAREDKINSLAISMVSKGTIYTDCVIINGGSIIEAIGAVECCRDKLVTRWKEK